MSVSTLSVFAEADKSTVELFEGFRDHLRKTYAIGIRTEGVTGVDTLGLVEMDGTTVGDEELGAGSETPRLVHCVPVGVFVEPGDDVVTEMFCPPPVGERVWRVNLEVSTPSGNDRRVELLDRSDRGQFSSAARELFVSGQLGPGNRLPFRVCLGEVTSTEDLGPRLQQAFSMYAPMQAFFPRVASAGPGLGDDGFIGDDATSLLSQRRLKAWKRMKESWPEPASRPLMFPVEVRRLTEGGVSREVQTATPSPHETSTYIGENWVLVPSDTKKPKRLGSDVFSDLLGQTDVTDVTGTSCVHLGRLFVPTSMGCQSKFDPTTPDSVMARLPIIGTQQ